MNYPYYTSISTRRNRGQYIPIDDHPSDHGNDNDELEGRILQWHLMGRSVWWGVGLVTAVVCMAMATSTSSMSSSPYNYMSLSEALQHNLRQQQQQSPHNEGGGKHTIPTLLSVVHHETGDYLWALKSLVRTASSFQNCPVRCGPAPPIHIGTSNLVARSHPNQPA